MEEKMSKRFGKIICLLLSAVLVLETSYYVDAATKEKIVYADNSGTIAITENDETRTTICTDTTNNTQMVLVYNKTTGIIKNVASGIEIVLKGSPSEGFSPCKILGTRTEYEYEFCQLGQFRYTHHDMPLSEFIDLIDGTITALKIVALVFTIATFVLTGVGLEHAQALAQGILNPNSPPVPYSQYRIHMTFSESCAEFWESDPYYPGGGFWFLGYTANPNFFNWYIY